MKLDLKLLKKIFLAERPPGKEQEAISLILNYCKNIQNLTYKLDSENNLFITKNTNNQKYVSCMIAHMDSIITHKGDRLISIRNGEIRGFQKSDHTQCSLGADDGIGICIVLQLLKELEDVKVIFTTQEEIGGIGAYAACYNKDFFKNINFFIQADRRGTFDLITPLKTGEFSDIHGSIHIAKGIADDIQIATEGKDLNLYIKGNCDLTTANAQMYVFGLLSKNIKTPLGAVGNMSLNTLFNLIPGIDLEAQSPFINDINKINRAILIIVILREIYAQLICFCTRIEHKINDIAVISIARLGVRTIISRSMRQSYRTYHVEVW